MDKRGQFFIFVAIIVALLVFTLITKSNIIREEVTLQNFEQLSQNYLTESPKVINYAIYSVQSPETSLSTFTEEFVNNYAKNNDPNIGLVYLYNDPGNNKVVIKNLLSNEKVTFNISNNFNVLFDTSQTVTGDLCVTETGICTQGSGNLCDVEQNYCVLSGGSLSGPIALKIGDISYDFTLPENNKGFIVIVKSKEGDTTKVDVSQNII